MKKACKFCGSLNNASFEATERMFGLGGSFAYSECLDCGSLQMDEIPQNLGEYYQRTGYYSFLPLNHSGFARKVYKRIRMKLLLATQSKIFEPRDYGYWLKKLAPGFHFRIADVGCGNGQLLYELYAAGFTDLHGFDPFMEKDQAVNTSLHLWKKRIEASDGLFDLIMLHHAFEHMENPVEALQACYDKLKPGGKLLVRTPVTDAAVWKEKRAYWVQLDAPRHLIIPSVTGFQLVSQSIGLTFEELLFDSSAFQFWGTSLYEKGFSLDLKLVEQHFSPEELAELEKKALLYNQEGKGDQVCFFLRKPL
ncbi:class I SAM-dependent methyltransferase [Algoriphagus sp.]|uniref:class I SAM-dependent methyltransferase n=1 Tax=Algoriphagus sp. TaxID=1872435 RepID=UPI003F6FC012